MPARSDWNVIDPEPENSLAKSDQPEVELAPDLQALAEQLTDDASYLAARYPANATLRQPNNAAAARSNLSRWSQAAVALFFIAIGSVATALVLHFSTSAPVVALNDHQATGEASKPSPSLAMADVAPANDISSPATVREVGINTAPAVRPSLSEVEMLRIQSTAFEQVIRKLQDELSRRAEQQARTERMVESLRQEVGELRQRLDDRQLPAATK